MTFKSRATTDDTIDDLGTGASRISWEDDRARHLARRIIEENPDGNDNTWTDELMKRAPEESCERSIYLYFMHNAACAYRRGSRKRRYGRPAASAAIRRAGAKLRHRLLDTIMPNGKPLRDCTGADCTRFGKTDIQRGQWLLRLGEEVGPRQRVGEVLSEKQVSALRRTTTAGQIESRR